MFGLGYQPTEGRSVSIKAGRSKRRRRRRSIMKPLKHGMLHRLGKRLISTTIKSTKLKAA